MSRKILGSIFFIALFTGLFAGCQKSYQARQDLDVSEEIVLTIGGPWEDVRALENVCQEFHEVYPNCTVEYEFIQDYKESISKRLSTKDGKLDIFFHNNIQADSEILPYSLELFSHSDRLDLSDTYEGMITNFTLMNSDVNATPEIYTIPTGGELRGMFVNITLLKSLGLSVPTNSTELINACKVLSEHGYVPLQGNPGTFAQQFMFPYVCNIIVNSGQYEEYYNRINQAKEGSSTLFEAPMSFLYSMVENKYYNYKYVETEYGTFTDGSNEGVARYFLNIVSDGNDGYEKKDDIGSVAFMPAPMTVDVTIAKMKEDYHSNIDYTFILSPVSEEGGFAYISPAQGLAISKNSQHIDWSLEFLNFFFQKNVNEKFAEEFGIIPNNSNALKYIEKKFDIKDNQISQLGQMTFDYAFYGIITKSLTEVSKGNNPKYMESETKMHDFNYYMDRLEKRFEEQRTGSDLIEDD